MRHQDPLDALTAFYERQPIGPSAAIGEALKRHLANECAEPNLRPLVTSFGRFLPVAAAVMLGMLTPSTSQQELKKLSDQIEAYQLASAALAEPKL